MAAVIQGILKESRDYYRALKRELVGKLLISSSGSLLTKNIKGYEYLYVRKNVQKKRIYLYIGPKNDDTVIKISEELNNRRKNIDQLRSSKKAMKELHMDNSEIVNEDYISSLRALFSHFERVGLWDEGLQIIGSWCFKIYQNNFGVEFYPERTIDVDIAVKIPYQGKNIDIAQILKSMGFDEQFDYQTGIIKYRCSDFIIEFLQHQQGDGSRRKLSNDTLDLGITTQAVPYLNILLNNPAILIARDLGRVCIPAMPAFVVHKLIVASCRKDKLKKIKDYNQVEAVCKTMVWNPKEITELARIANSIHKTWRDKMLRSYRSMTEHVSFEPKGTERALVSAGLIPSAAD